MATEYAARIAAGLRGERARQGYTQDRLAELSGLSLNTIRRLERGERRATAEQLLKLAAALEIPATTLLPDLATEPTSRGAA